MRIILINERKFQQCFNSIRDITEKVQTTCSKRFEFLE